MTKRITPSEAATAQPEEPSVVLTESGVSVLVLRGRTPNSSTKFFPTDSSHFKPAGPSRNFAFITGSDTIRYVEPGHGFTEYFKDGKTKKITKAYQSATITPIVYATYTLTPNGQIDTVTDANSNVTNPDYDGHDRLARTFFSDPANGLACPPG